MDVALNVEPERQSCCLSVISSHCCWFIIWDVGKKNTRRNPSATFIVCLVEIFFGSWRISLSFLCFSTVFSYSGHIVKWTSSPVLFLVFFLLQGLLEKQKTNLRSNIVLVSVSRPLQRRVRRKPRPACCLMIKPCLQCVCQKNVGRSWKTNLQQKFFCPVFIGMNVKR